MNISSSAGQLGAEANSQHTLYSLYTALAREFMIELPVCGALEAGEEVSSEEVAAWLKAADECIPVHQLRQFLQTSKLANQESLRTALDHYLCKPQRSDTDRDKVDFLLVQFFSSCASSQLQDADATLEFVARTLEPVLGTAETAVPEALRPLEALVQSADACRSLQELFASGILEQGRSLKASLGDNYFDPCTLVALTRFNFLMRRVFFRRMHQDLNATLEGLRNLELRGVNILDCRSAEFSAEEPVGRLRMICQSWKVMFQAEYSSGQPLRLLADLRAVIDARLEQESAGASSEETSLPKLRAKAASASGDSSSEANAASPGGDTE